MDFCLKGVGFVLLCFVCFVFLITDSVSLRDWFVQIIYFFLIQFWWMYVSRNLSFHLGCPICWYIIVYSILFFFNIYLFNFWLHWVFVPVCRLSLVAASGGYSSLQCVGFSLWWLLLLQSTGSRRVGFSSCATWA